MIKLPKYLIAYNKTEMPDHILVISTINPFMIGKVWMFKDSYQFIEFCSSYKGLGLAAIPGYNIALTFETTVTGPRAQLTVPNSDIFRVTMQEMAEFYRTERIQVKKGFYKKYQVSGST